MIEMGRIDDLLKRFYHLKTRVLVVNYFYCSLRELIAISYKKKQPILYVCCIYSYLTLVEKNSQIKAPTFLPSRNLKCHRCSLVM